MKDTAKALLESTMYPEMDGSTKNLFAFSQLDSISESQRMLTGYTPDKVIVLVDESTGDYMIEFSNNLERLMHDQNLDMEAAVEAVCAADDISRHATVNILVDESSLGKIDFVNVSETATYNFIRM